MDLTPIIPKNKKVIQAYAPGMFQINEEEIKTPILLTPTNIHPLTTSDINTIIKEALPLLEKAAPEILLIGCGTTITPLEKELRKKITQHNITPDLMDTGAACRTYNILLGEDRQVAAIIKPL